MFLLSTKSTLSWIGNFERNITEWYSFSFIGSHIVSYVFTFPLFAFQCCIRFFVKLTFWWNISGPKYNKEQYLQANCQFVVKSSGDYSVHLADPDTIVNWDLIEQVVLKTTASVPSCPICLYPPKAAKVAKCGHVFCWPCILHYLALSDHSWRKCKLIVYILNHITFLLNNLHSRYFRKKTQVYVGRSLR